MKPTDFAYHLTKFLSVYLVVHKNASANTLRSYRDAFKLLIEYCWTEKGISPEKLTLPKIDAGIITGFLNWLESERSCGISTRNQRLAAIHSFFRYVQIEDPTSLYHYQKIISIPVKRKDKKIVVEHLSPEGMKILLEQPDRSTAKGRRDLALLATLYDSGARVQELIDLRARDVRTEIPGTLVLNGKGGKLRCVPLMPHTADILAAYIKENRLDEACRINSPLFFNARGDTLTRGGVGYILNKYAQLAHEQSALVPERLHCHMTRHSKGCHLLAAGVNLVYIRDFLGHSNVKTTEVYARADMELKRKALESAYPDLIDSSLPDWNKNPGLIEWLNSL